MGKSKYDRVEAPLGQRSFAFWLLVFLVAIGLLTSALALVFGGIAFDRTERKGPPSTAPITTNFYTADFTTFPASDFTVFSFGPFAANDGTIVANGDGSITVVANPFNLTVPQSQFGLLDHTKSLRYYKKPAPVAKNQAVTCTMRASFQGYGTQNHPFGSNVVNAQSDPRLALGALNGISFSTWVASDIYMTNQTIGAIKERLPVGRTDLANGTMGNYSATSYIFELAARVPSDIHTLQIVYDRHAPTPTIYHYIDGNLFYTDTALGYPLPSTGGQFMAINHGGVPTFVEPTEWRCGFSLLTFLDGALTPNPTFSADFLPLVQLSAGFPVPYYYDTLSTDALGDPIPNPTFFDPSSLPSSRLFGQGGSMTVYSFAIDVTTYPSA